MSKYKLLCVDANPKTMKGNVRGWLTGILHLAPASLSGTNTCKYSTAGCRAACLNLAGRGGAGGPDNKIQRARIRKTRWLYDDRAGFVAALGDEIRKLAVDASDRQMQAAVRLNGTSDIRWEKLAPELFARFRGYVKFYDYTKYPWLARQDRPPGYDITWSRRGRGDDDRCRGLLAGGDNVVVVFGVKKGAPLPATWQGYPVFDGDTTDLRFLDPPGHVVGVRAKGPAIKDQSGFVVRVGG